MEWLNIILQGVLVGGLYAMFATGLALIFGVMRLVNIAHGDLIVLAAYVALVATSALGVNPLVSLLVVVPLMAAFGYALQRFVLNRTLGPDPLPIPAAALIFRLRGHYFAIGTWVMAEVFRLIASQVSELGGGSGISLPVSIVTSLAPNRQLREFLIYWIAFSIVVSVLAGIVLLLRSRYGLALTAIRDNEAAARSNGVEVTRIKLAVYIAVAFGTAVIGALIFLQKLRVSPEAAFSVNDWTAFVIFIVVIGGVGRVEGPLVGTILFFVLRQFLADLGSLYLLMLGACAIAVMLIAPKGLWGLIADRFGWQLFPLARRVEIGGKPVRRQINNG